MFVGNKWIIDKILLKVWHHSVVKLCVIELRALVEKKLMQWCKFWPSVMLFRKRKSSDFFGKSWRLWGCKKNYYLLCKKRKQHSAIDCLYGESSCYISSPFRWMFIQHAKGQKYHPKIYTRKWIIFFSFFLLAVFAAINLI